MDILFGKATRQLSALKNDIDTFLESSGSTSLQGKWYNRKLYDSIFIGQISASMTTLSKTLNDLEEMIKREVSMERRSTFKERHRLLRQDYDGYRARYEQARRAQRERERQSERDALLFRGNDPTSSSSSIPIRPEPNLNETLLKEKESRTLDYTGNRLDEYIHIGMTTLENLRNQRTTLKVPA